MSRIEKIPLLRCDLGLAIQSFDRILIQGTGMPPTSDHKDTKPLSLHGPVVFEICPFHLFNLTQLSGMSGIQVTACHSIA